MSQKIRIKLKSYDHSLVDKSADKIVKTVKSTGRDSERTYSAPYPKEDIHRAAFSARE